MPNWNALGRQALWQHRWLRSQPAWDIILARASRAGRIDCVAPIYHLRVAWREKHGMVRRPMRDEVIKAPNLREAVAAALSDGSGLLSAGMNFGNVTDEDGLLVWTLRMDYFNAKTR